MAILVSLFAVGISEAATITAASNGGQWHNGSSWVGGVAPGATDDVVLDSSSGNITVSGGNRSCQSLDCTGYTGTLTIQSGRQLLVGYTSSPSGNLLTLSSSMTLSASWSTILCGRYSGPVRGVDTAGQVVPTLKLINAELFGDVIATDNGLYCYEYFASNDHAIVAPAVRVSGSTTTAYFGASAIACGLFDARTYAVCDVAGASLSIGDGVNIVQANDVTFGSVSFARGQYHEIRGANIFDSLVLSGASAATTIKFQANKTVTLTGTDPLPSGDASGQVTLYGTGAWYVVSANDVAVDYVTVDYSNASGATFSAGANSVDGGNNSGWSF